jgi:hypothetical protein
MNLHGWKKRKWELTRKLEASTSEEYDYAISKLIAKCNVMIAKLRAKTLKKKVKK